MILLRLTSFFLSLIREVEKCTLQLLTLSAACCYTCVQTSCQTGDPGGGGRG